MLTMLVIIAMVALAVLGAFKQLSWRTVAICWVVLIALLGLFVILPTVDGPVMP